MRSQIRILLATLALSPLLVWGPELPEALARMETFRVAEVDVRGTRFLTEDSVVERLDLGAFASVWGDREAWVERVEAHPLVRRAEVGRRLPNGLLVTIEERTPIALAGAPTLEPLDGEGVRLPIDPTRYALDLPVITSTRTPPPGASVFPESVRGLATELEALQRADEELARRISTVRRTEDGSVAVRLVSPDVDLLFPPGISWRRLQEAELALADAISREPGRVPAVVDLRFAGQVVVRRTGND